MSRGALQRLAVLALLAGFTALARPAAAQPIFTWFTPPPPAPPIDSPAFALRPPPPGRPGYLATIAYIDNGLRYVDPHSGFFVSPYGSLCFFGVLHTQRSVFRPRQAAWCTPPAAVAQVDAIENDVTYVSELHLLCKHAAPECFHEVGYLYRARDEISVAILPSHKEKAALEYLIYLMGGGVPADRPWRN